MRNTIKIGLIIIITISLLTPISLVLADDTEPPVISSVTYAPHAGVRTDPGFYLYQSCYVTDNVSVADVRIIIMGPAGFTPINASMVNLSGGLYSYEVHNVTLSGMYEFYIWAIDISNNTAQSATYHMLVFDDYLSYIYVDVDNIAGPWNGTAAYPLQSISDALAVLATNGTIFLYEGLYENTSILLEKSMTLIGENQQSTLLDGGGAETSYIVSISGNHQISIINLALRNAMVGVLAHNTSDTTLASCTFSQCTDAAISLSESQNCLVTDCVIQNNNHGIQLSNCHDNQFYHNNFFNNVLHVSSFFNTSSNAWDNGITGNYWDDYRLSYPGATVIPTTGTWNTPYLVIPSDNNTDHHPWVYPSGVIDTLPPQVTVLYPNGGEVVHGEIMIQWIATDDFTTDLNGSLLLEYSADNGNNWHLLASHQNNTGFYIWNTTLVPNGDFYLISISTLDEFFNIGSDVSDSPFSINNYPAVAFEINGPSQGGNGIPFNFSVVASEPPGEEIYYMWDWGDGNISDWYGPYDSSIPATVTYTWATDANYSMRVKAKDAEGVETNWSAIHVMVIAEQVNFSNTRLGHIYFKLFSFNRSFIFSDFLARLSVVFILTSHEMNLEAFTTDIVESVEFKAMNQMKAIDTIVIDDNKTDGFSCNMNITRGIYILNITAFDANGTLVDRYSLFTVFFMRIGRYATDPLEGRLQRLRVIPRLRH
ncbi:MAG: right-handed parallel beta-helix repeat-containing protein [Candidatus Thermoplasmatota archaeon]|nr:right-handed parallel beta-helix repeat-containing protein [Candidatus Thermoplasmatota archaeon]